MSELRVEALGEEFTLRPANERDRGYVLSTWLRTYQDRRPCDPGPYFTGHRRAAEALFNAGLVRVAVREGSPWTAHAWVCGAPRLLHYVYVPVDVRKRGFGTAIVRALCGETGVRSHKWAAGAVVRGFDFDPYQIGALHAPEPQKRSA